MTTDTKQAITEKDTEIVDAWFKRAREIKDPWDLADFIKHLGSAYSHDYGTIVHAVTAAAVAAAWCMNAQPEGGITGFQAGCVFWEFRRRWLSEEGPARLVNYENLLFPQYERQFARVIRPETWTYLQEKARKFLAEKQGHPEVVAHWQSIADGKVPFGFEVADE